MDFTRSFLPLLVLFSTLGISHRGGSSPKEVTPGVFFRGILKECANTPSLGAACCGLGVAGFGASSLRGSRYLKDFPVWFIAICAGGGGGVKNLIHLDNIRVLKGFLGTRRWQDRVPPSVGVGFDNCNFEPSAFEALLPPLFKAVLSKRDCGVGLYDSARPGMLLFTTVLHVCR